MRIQEGFGCGVKSEGPADEGSNFALGHVLRFRPVR